MAEFASRSLQIEEMDDLNCSGAVVDQTLRELEFINKWLGGNEVTISALDRLLPGREPGSISIADLGCGGGDMLKLVNDWATRKNREVELTGIDANPNIIGFAERNLSSLKNARFYALNIFSDEFKQFKFDVVIGTLFFHHFTQAELIEFFRSLKQQVKKGIIINDIHRHPLAYYSIKWLTKSFSKSPMVVSDAPLSVLRAFKKREIVEVLKAAGFSEYSISWRWAFRWQVVIKI